MAYLDAYLPPCPGYGFEGGPNFSTRIVEMANGRERRNADWSIARHSYTAPFLNISKEAYRELKRMHMVCRGKLHCFRFKDYLDFQAANEIFAIGDGVQTKFQLAKFSTIDGISYERPVYAIVAATITDNGAPVSPVVDMERGTVTFAAPPADGHVLRWTGEFDVWVRFDQDNLPFTLDNVNATNGQVELLEVPPPEEES
ncbi:DUF2460 domain-containing protein [Xanthomonas sp. AM6]|uniref:DUF2460 domain-containing protein n=1 Tax=Xanthomonas sp. AM6 TaxID=2982531 RepID=UPI0021D92B26|nr:DUF2460 domain-containing protein [Xanthomonas sp. AM6]UYB51145.1 DUF2460 domain-containing protein [Xanthomonas sp. AM6]